MRTHKKVRLGLALALCAVALSLAASIALAQGTSTSTASAGPRATVPYAQEPLHGCTVFTVAKGDQVFFGGSDDYIEPDSYYWVDPGRTGRYGAIWVGKPDNVQQGVNEVGLAYDSNGLARVEVNPHRERQWFSGGYTSIPIHILHECATVQEAIDWIDTHQRPDYMHDQMQFADRSGDAVLISPGTDGEMVLTRKPRGDGYLVSTNFNVANPVPGQNYPCTRYDTATEMLSELVAGEGELRLADAVSVLDAVHVERTTSWTIASLLVDLVEGKVYLYLFYQFDRPLVLDVAQELAHPRAAGPLSRLFPEDVRQEATRRYQSIQARGSRCEWLGMGWLGALLASLVVLALWSVRAPGGLVTWAPVGAVFGPLGLLVRLIGGRGRRHSCWRAALIETAGDAAPTVIAVMVFIAVLLALQVGGTGTQLHQVLLILVPPVAIGWLLVQGPLLALGSGAPYLRVLWRRLPHALVVANLGMGGAFAFAIPLLNLSLYSCRILPLPPSGWVALAWWALVVLSVLAGGLPLYLYEVWALHRGFRAWSAVAQGGDDVAYGPWRKLWWWVLVSYAALVGGVVASTLLQQLLGP
ncbi:MAG: hypothetical protein JXA09_12565 [Anaerolineae bacterium]|nr:hypothetical protein [Anaerolineae bacterium]